MGVSDEMEKRAQEMEMVDQELAPIASQGGQWGMAMSPQTADKLMALGLLTPESTYGKRTRIPGWLQWCLGL